jgi:hypothetical protein
MIGCDSIFTTRASPEQVLRALTDFTESHLETWNRTLDPKTYELRESGQTWAVAQVCQGSARTDDQILIDRSASQRAIDPSRKLTEWPSITPGTVNLAVSDTLPSIPARVG